MASIIGEFTKVKRIIGKRYSSLYLISQVLHIPIPKECLSNVHGAMMLVLKEELEIYSPELEGVPVAFNEKSAKLREDYECMISAQSCVQCDLQCEFVVFKPKVGDILNGVVNKVTPNLFGCFIHGYFYATIHRKPAEPKRLSNIKVARKIRLRVTKLQVDGNGVLSIAGEILEPQRKQRKNTEIITQNGDRQRESGDSGIETSDLNSSLTRLEQVSKLADQSTSQTDSSQSSKTKEKPQTKSSSSLKLSKNAAQKIRSVVDQETAVLSASNTDANLTPPDSNKKKRKKSKKAKQVSADSRIKENDLNSGLAEVEQDTKRTDKNTLVTDSSQSSKTKKKKTKTKSSHSLKSSQNATPKAQSAVNEETAVSSTGTIIDANTTASDGDKKKRKKAKKAKNASTDSGTEKSDLNSSLPQVQQNNKFADRNMVQTDSSPSSTKTKKKSRTKSSHSLKLSKNATQKVQSAANEETAVPSTGTTDDANSIASDGDKKKRKKAKKAKHTSADPGIEKSILNSSLQQSEQDTILADPNTSQINSSPSSKTKKNSQTKSARRLKLNKNATEKVQPSVNEETAMSIMDTTIDDTNTTARDSDKKKGEKARKEKKHERKKKKEKEKANKLKAQKEDGEMSHDPATNSTNVTNHESQPALVDETNMENIVSPTIDNCSSLSWLKKEKLFISPREMRLNQEPVTAISENQQTDAGTKSEKKKSPKKRKQATGATFSSPPVKRMTRDTISELLPENLPPPTLSQNTPSTSSSNLNDTDAMLYYLRKSGMSVDNMPLSELKSWFISQSNSSAANANGSDLNSTVNQGDATSAKATKKRTKKNLNEQKTEVMSNLTGCDPMSESTPNPEVSTENTENEAQSSTKKFKSNDSEALTSKDTKKSKKKKKKKRSETTSTDSNNNPELTSTSGVVISHPLSSDYSTTLNCSPSIETDSSVHEKPKSLKRKKKDKNKEKKHKRLKN